MHVKYFKMVPQRVPDPMHPGRTVPTPRFIDPDSPYPVRHGGKSYEPDANGWVEVPQEVGETLVKFRRDGSGFFTVGEMASAVNLGQLDGNDQPARAEKPAPRPKAKPDA